MSATFEPPPILKNIQISGWAALLAASLGALAVGSLSYAAAIAIGGALGLGNFRGMDICFARFSGARAPASNGGIMSYMVPASSSFWPQWPALSLGGVSRLSVS